MKFLLIYFLAYNPASAGVVTDTCSGFGYSVRIEGSSAFVSGPDFDGLRLRRTPESSETSTYPIFTSDDDAISAIYFDALRPELEVDFKYSMNLKINGKNFELICTLP
jgi:hypothetical protein